MPSVLLVHEPNPPFETRHLVAQLSSRISGAQAVPLRPSRWRDTIRALRTPDRVVHAFGSRALAVAVVLTRGQVIYSATRFPNRGAVAWLRAALRYRPIRVVCASDAERRAWVTGGVPMDACTLVRPGVSLAMPAEAKRTARQRFGYRDDERVIFMPLPRVGHDRAVAIWTGALLNVLDANVRVLAWSDGGNETLHALRPRLISPGSFDVLDDAAPDAGFAASDAVLLPPSEIVSPTVVAMAMASGRPIVGRVTPQVCELLEDRHTALLTAGRTPRLLADRMIDVFSDAALAQKIADRARAEAYEHLLPSRLAADFRTLYASASHSKYASIDTSNAAVSRPPP